MKLNSTHTPSQPAIDTPTQHRPISPDHGRAPARLPDCPVAGLAGTAFLRSARPTGTDAKRLNERNESALSIPTDTMEGRFRPACPAWVGIEIPAGSAGESMTAAGHGAAQPAAAGCGLLLLMIGDYPPACKRHVQTHVHAGASLLSRLFLTHLGANVRVLWPGG